MFGASSELASVMEFGFYLLLSWPRNHFKVHCGEKVNYRAVDYPDVIGEKDMF